MLPVLFHRDWDEEAGRWKKMDTQDIPTLEDAYELFQDEILSVSKDSESGLVTLAIEWRDRFLAAEWANALTARLNLFLRKRDIEEAQKSIEYLNAELERHSSLEIRQGIYSLIQRQVETAMLANVREEYLFRILDIAVASDEDNYIWPKPAVFVLAGFVFGAGLAFFVTVLRNQLGRDSSELSR